MPGKLSYYLSEAIGTFVMMFLGISAIAFNFATEFMAGVLPSEPMRLLLTDFSSLWVYLIAPFVGSIVAVIMAVYLSSSTRPLCAKLNHREEPCLYDACEYS